MGNINKGFMFFNEVLEGQADAVFGLVGAFQADVRPHKVDLLVGQYRDALLRTELFPSVLRAQRSVTAKEFSADYLPIDGSFELCHEVGKLLFDEKVWEDAHGRIFAAHTPGGTAALRTAAEFLLQEVTKTIFIPDPTWPNHRQIFERAGFQVETYPYYNRGTKKFDCDAAVQALQGAAAKTAVLFHASCHNPTGRDPNVSEWRRLLQVCIEKRLLPLFDVAYQGFGEELDRDVESMRSFMKEGLEMIVAYSCSKNFSLYCQRVGALFVIDENAAVKFRVGSQIKRIIRGLYSSPPAYGAHIVTEILRDPELRREWLEDMSHVRRRLSSTREEFIDRLMRLSKRVDFSYLRGHQGLFMMLDVKKDEVQKLIDGYAVYLLSSGRINVAGLTQGNMDTVVNALLQVLNT